jgi:hypothetical protein
MLRAIHHLVPVTSRAALCAVLTAGCAIQAADPTDQMLSTLDGTEAARPAGEAAVEAVRLSSPHLPKAARDRAGPAADAMADSPKTPMVTLGKIAVGIHTPMDDRAPLASATKHCEAVPDQRFICCTFVGDIAFACKTFTVTPSMEPN